MSTTLVVENVSCKFGALKALDEVSLTVESGEIVGLLGPNGAGKSTLLNCLSGIVQTYDGTIGLRGIDLQNLPPWRRSQVGLGRTFQTPRLLERETVFTNIAVGCQPLGEPSFWGELFNSRESRKARKRDNHLVEETLNLLSLRSLAFKRVSELPFARRRIVEIGRAIIGSPALLLLDEPAAGLEQRERLELRDVLQHVRERVGLAMVLVEHDVRFLESVAERSVALDFGKVIVSGSTADVLRDETVRAAYFGTKVL